MRIWTSILRRQNTFAQFIATRPILGLCEGAVIWPGEHLGRLLLATDDDWLAVAGNIKNARESWGSLAQVLGREGADPKVSRNFYTAVTQQVLLFGAEAWVLTRKMESALEAFQGRVARKLTGRQPHCGRYGRWS